MISDSDRNYIYPKHAHKTRSADIESVPSKILTWEKQIDLVCQNVSRKPTIIKLLSKYDNQHSLKQYYNSNVLPVFDFGCVVWGNNTSSNLTRLVKLQKRAATMILKADFMTPSKNSLKN